jgi:hypothetical protein
MSLTVVDRCEYQRLSAVTSAARGQGSRVNHRSSRRAQRGTSLTVANDTPEVVLVYSGQRMLPQPLHQPALRTDADAQPPGI